VEEARITHINVAYKKTTLNGIKPGMGTPVLSKAAVQKSGK
jgi:hypothetical protein